MIRLSREVGTQVIIFTSPADGRIGRVFLKRIIAQVTPEHREHTETMCLCECGTDFLNLAAALRRSKINGGTHTQCTHVVRLLHRTEHYLIEFVRIREEFVVIELHDERDLSGVRTRDNPERTNGRRDRVASTIDGKAH